MPVNVTINPDRPTHDLCRYYTVDDKTLTVQPWRASLEMEPTLLITNRREVPRNVNRISLRVKKDVFLPYAQLQAFANMLGDSAGRITDISSQLVLSRAYLGYLPDTLTLSATGNFGEADITATIGQWQAIKHDLDAWLHGDLDWDKLPARQHVLPGEAQELFAPSAARSLTDILLGQR